MKIKNKKIKKEIESTKNDACHENQDNNYPLKNLYTRIS